MNKIIKLNIRSFANKRTFKNYLLINILIFLICFLILITDSYSQNQIKKIINDESNKNINISKYNNFNDVKKFFELNNANIESIYFDARLLDFKIDNSNYDLLSKSEDFDYEHFSIIINSKHYFESFKINNISVENIIYDDSISVNNIYINQKISKKLCEENVANVCYISFNIKDYFTIDKILNSLKDNNIDANLNNNASYTLSSYINIFKIVNIFFIFFIIAFIIITFFTIITFLSEQKDNIKIYVIVGYNFFNIFTIYLINFVVFTIISFLFSVFIFSLFCLVLFIFGLNLFSELIKIIFLPLLIIMIFNIIITFLSISFIIKKFTSNK